MGMTPGHLKNWAPGGCRWGKLGPCGGPPYSLLLLPGIVFIMKTILMMTVIVNVHGGFDDDIPVCDICSPNQSSSKLQENSLTVSRIL